MNFFSVNEKIIALCGRHNIHVYPLSFLPAVSMLPLELMHNLPSNSKASPEKLSAVCCEISSCGKYVVAADSGKNVFLFEYAGSAWELFSSWEMEKRVVKVQFDRRTTFVIMTDKTGDIWLSYMSLKTITSPRRAMGHTSFILDVILTEDNKKIITCDRDEKIRVSNFPQAHEIIDFKLGHKEAVINISLVNFDHQLISISAEGTLKMWHMTENKLLKTWNVFTILNQPRPHECEVLRMKATDTQGRIYVSVIISGFKELPVFEVNTIDRSIRQFGQVKLESDFTDMAWYRNFLFVFHPESGSVKKYYVSENGLVSDVDFAVPAIPSAKRDWKCFADYNKPFFPLKKRVPSDVLERIEDARQQIQTEFGPLSEEEPEPAKALKIQTTPSEHVRMHNRLVALSKDVKYPAPAVIADHIEKEKADLDIPGEAADVAGPSTDVPVRTTSYSELIHLIEPSESGMSNVTVKGTLDDNAPSALLDLQLSPSEESHAGPVLVPKPAYVSILDKVDTPATTTEATAVTKGAPKTASGKKNPQAASSDLTPSSDLDTTRSATSIPPGDPKDSSK